MALIAPEGPQGSGSLSEVELLIFLLDGSGSMWNPDEGGTKTFDGRTKATHLFEITKQVLTRLDGSAKKPAFRVCLIYFAQSATIEEVQLGGSASKYFPTNNAIGALRNPCDVTHGGKTSIVEALSAARQVLDLFVADPGMPATKNATLFLFSDGQETVKSKDDVCLEVAALRSHPLSPVVAVVSLGTDADDDLLLDLANQPSERQIRHLATAQVLGQISQEPSRLFLKGHSQGELTAKQAEAIRQFVNVLSQTVNEPAVDTL